MNFLDLRKEYHETVCREIIRINKVQKKKIECPNFADIDNRNSIQISWGIIKELGYNINYGRTKEQTTGKSFEDITRDFIEKAFSRLYHLRPGKWGYATETKKYKISDFDQYRHLFELQEIIKKYTELKPMLRDYLITPDIIISRSPVDDDEINKNEEIINGRAIISNLTPLRSANHKNPPVPILHASISCKWTLRSDRAQNVRTEALGFIRNRKGNLPHIVAVTAEPLPSRINALALGTGDLDCVYHFALYELEKAVSEIDSDSQREDLKILIEGRRLRDISDLPFDLAI
jgi:hypothetical protein